MKVKPNRYFSTDVAETFRQVAEKLYETGPSKVYDWANHINLNYDVCVPCEAETPTISDIKHHTCAICGTSKNI